LKLICGPGSLVGILTGYGLDGPGIESWWGQDLTLFYFPENSINFIILSSSVQIIVQAFFRERERRSVCVCVCVNMMFVGISLEGGPRFDTRHELPNCVNKQMFLVLCLVGMLERW
jgi:hypothetical protein